MTQRDDSLLVIMGVSGCGKSTVGKRLADRLGYPFLEADDFHPPSNIRKMSGGEPLTDHDRGPWIDAIINAVDRVEADCAVLACSALTPFVRSRLEMCSRKLAYIALDTSRVDLVKRLTARDHFMPVTLLQSQLDALSIPKDAILIDADQPVEMCVSQIVQHIATRLPHPAIHSS